MSELENGNEMNNEVIKRGFWLSAYLIIVTIINATWAMVSFSTPEAVTSMYPSDNEAIAIITGAISLMVAGACILIWNWKKVGIYGMYVLIIISAISGIYFGLAVTSLISVVFSAGIIYLFTKNKMAKFI